MKKMYPCVILTAFLLFGCSTELPEAVTTTDNGRLWCFVEISEEVRDAAELFLWITLPPEHPGQEVRVNEIYPEPYEIVEDSPGGNRIIFWRITDFEGMNEVCFYYDFTFTRSEVVTDVDPTKIDPYDTDSEEYKRYTQSEPWIELTDEIKVKAQEIAGSETNPYYNARAIFDWVIENMYYKYPDMEDRGAEKSFKSLKGDCGEFSVVFCALCRAVGIPARTVTCVWLDQPGHQWAEILLPGYGWMPVDTSIAQMFAGNSSITKSKFILHYYAKKYGLPTMDYHYLFGNLYTERLIVSIGNNIEVSHPDIGISRTFSVLQPGGLIAYPVSIEASGLPSKTFFSQAYVFGEKATDIKHARRQASKYKGVIVE